MKSNIAPLAFALLATASLQAQSTNTTNFVEGPAGVTISLTLRSQVPGAVEVDSRGRPVVDSLNMQIPTYERTIITTNSAGEPTKDEFLEAGRIASYRYGNAELLRDLLAAGELGQGITNVSGWGIFSTSRGEEGSGETTLVARRVVRVGNQFTTNSVPLEGILGLDIVPIVSTFSFQETLTYNYNRAGELLSTVETGSGSFADEGIAYLEFANQSIPFTGTITGTTLVVPPGQGSPAIGSLSVGMLIEGNGVEAGTRITSMERNTRGGPGRYALSTSNNIPTPVQLTAESLAATSANGFMTERGREFRWYPTSDRSNQESVLLSDGVSITGLVGNSEAAPGEGGVLMTGSVNLGRTVEVRAP